MNRFDAGFYAGFHLGCDIYQPHRHPFTNIEALPIAERPGVERKTLPQPRVWLVEHRATITYRVAQDTDGTLRLVDAGYRLTTGEPTSVDLDEWPWGWGPRSVEPDMDDALYEAVIGAIGSRDEGEIDLDTERIILDPVLEIVP